MPTCGYPWTTRHCPFRSVIAVIVDPAVARTLLAVAKFDVVTRPVGSTRQHVRTNGATGRELAGSSSSTRGMSLAASRWMMKATCITRLTRLGVILVLGAACAEDVTSNDDAALSINPAVAFMVHDLIHELHLDHRATHTAASTTGLFSDCATWISREGGCTMPGDHAIVVIPKGRTVIVDAQLQSRLAAVIVRGTLRFLPNRNTGLRVDTLLVDGGSLIIGTAAAPVGAAANTIARISFPSDSLEFSAHDPRTATHGLISDGEVIITGKTRAAFAFLARPALREQATLVFPTAPDGWSAGDAVVVPATRFTRSFAPAENEVRTISSIATCPASTRTCVELDAPLSYDHVIPTVSAPAGTPALEVPVANLTRNVIIETETSPAPLPIANRGHVMLMSNTAAIHGALFKDLGRTDKRRPIEDPVYDDATKTIVRGDNARARYALHFHEAGVLRADLRHLAQVTDSVMWGSPGWGFVNHSSAVSFRNNVAYDFVGAGFVTEDGDEGGEFVENLAIGGLSTGSGPGVPRSTGTGEESMKYVREMFGNPGRLKIGDMGFGGHGFWFQGPDVRIEDNISAGNKGAGFVVWADGKYDPATSAYTGMPLDRLPPGAHPQTFAFAPDTAHVNQLGLQRFAGNRAFSSFIGLKVRFTTGFGNKPLETSARDFTEDLVGKAELGTSLIASSSFWSNRIGIIASYTHLSLKNVFVLGPVEGQPASMTRWPTWQPSAGFIVRGPHEVDFISNVNVDGYIVGAFHDGCDADQGTVITKGLRIDGRPPVFAINPCAE